MTPPGEAAGRFAAACLLGLALGAVYGFLRPLRPRHTLLSDSLFLLAAAWAWGYLGFGICLGDLRLGYTAGLFLGAVAFEQTLGRLLRPVFQGFWRGLGRAGGAILAPAKKIFKKIRKNAKKLFAIRGKWVTIEWNNRRNNRRTSGGSSYDREQPIKAPVSRGIPAEPPADEVRGAGNGGIVYRYPFRAAGKHSRHPAGK